MFYPLPLHRTCEPGSHRSASLPSAIADDVPFPVRSLSSRILDNQSLRRTCQFIFQQNVLGYLEKTRTLCTRVAVNIGIPVRQRLQLATDFAVSVYNRRIIKCLLHDAPFQKSAANRNRRVRNAQARASAHPRSLIFETILGTFEAGLLSRLQTFLTYRSLALFVRHPAMVINGTKDPVRDGAAHVSSESRRKLRARSLPRPRRRGAFCDGKSPFTKRSD
jgi:hypothetical protein